MNKRKSSQPKKITIQNWMSLSSALERLQLYRLFLPVRYSEAKIHQEAVANKLPIPPFEFQPSPFPFPPLHGEEWVLYMFSPLMRWESYWESIYKCERLMNYIAGFHGFNRAQMIYKKNCPKLLSLGKARDTFAHFINKLPNPPEGQNQSGGVRLGYSPISYTYNNDTYSTSVAELDFVCATVDAFLAEAKHDFSDWAATQTPKASQNPTNP